METTNRIPLDQADFATLKAFAELALGLEVKNGVSSTALRAKILQAAPNLTDVPALAQPPAPVAAPQEPVERAPAVLDKEGNVVVMPEGYDAKGENPAARPAAVSRPATNALMHPNKDPKVRLKFLKTDDKRAAKTVTISNNGFVCRYQRGHEVDVPYRIYLAALDAKTKVAVESDEVGEFGQPLMEWEEVQSYPFQIISMPSEAEIAAWHKATGSGFADRAPRTTKQAA